MLGLVMPVRLSAAACPAESAAAARRSWGGLHGGLDSGVGGGLHGRTVGQSRVQVPVQVHGVRPPAERGPGEVNRPGRVRDRVEPRLGPIGPLRSSDHPALASRQSAPAAP